VTNAEKIATILKIWLNSEEECDSIDSPSEIAEYCPVMCGFEISLYVAHKVWDSIATDKQKQKYDQHLNKIKDSKHWYDSDEYKSL
jgi:hypothetical protein